MTELRIGDNQISGPLAGTILLVSEAAFFLSFLAATGAIIFNTVTGNQVEQASLDACTHIALGSGGILAIIIVGQQLVTTVLGHFIK